MNSFVKTIPEEIGGIILRFVDDSFANVFDRSRTEYHVTLKMVFSENSPFLDISYGLVDRICFREGMQNHSPFVFPLCEDMSELPVFYTNLQHGISFSQNVQKNLRLGLRHRTLTNLRDLTIGPEIPPYFLQQLAPILPSCEKFESLSLQGINTEMFPSNEEIRGTILLEKFGNKLRSLRLHFSTLCCPDTQKHVAHHASSNCTRLELLEICGDAKVESLGTLWPAVGRQLSHLHLSVIEPLPDLSASFSLNEVADYCKTLKKLKVDLNPNRAASDSYNAALLRVLLGNRETIEETTLEASMTEEQVEKLFSTCRQLKSVKLRSLNHANALQTLRIAGSLVSSILIDSSLEFDEILEEDLSASLRATRHSLSCLTVDHGFFPYFSARFPYNFGRIRKLNIRHLRKRQIENILAMCPAVETFHAEVYPARFHTWSKNWNYDFSGNNQKLSEVSLVMEFAWSLDLRKCMTCIEHTLSSLPKAASLKLVQLKFACNFYDHSWKHLAKQLFSLLQVRSRKFLHFQFPMVEHLSKTFEKFEAAGTRLVLHEIESRV